MNISRILAAVMLSLFYSVISANGRDTIPSAFSRPLQWHAGVEITPSLTLQTNRFIRGENPEQKRIGGNFLGTARIGFSFSEDTREGQLYKGLYQGVGLGFDSFDGNKLLGTPVLIHVFQGAPIVHFNSRLWLGYEWKFGAAIGWKHRYMGTWNNSPVSTSVTAHMALGARLNYSLSDKWTVTLGVEASHYSNGNTSIPNSGVNTVGAVVGMTYTITPRNKSTRKPAVGTLEEEADRPEWFYDILAYGAWRKRVLTVGGDFPQLTPGHFGVAGIQLSPMRKFNRLFAAGAALDVQYDESGGLSPYWVEGSFDERIKFRRPPFFKQLGIGASAHAELIMPIFAINAGLGINMLNPKGDRRFYQSLSLKTFVLRNVFLNVGYRLGGFKDPQNLMLGVGVRL